MFPHSCYLAALFGWLVALGFCVEKKIGLNLSNEDGTPVDFQTLQKLMNDIYIICLEEFFDEVRLRVRQHPKTSAVQANQGTA